MTINKRAAPKATDAGEKFIANTEGGEHADHTLDRAGSAAAGRRHCATREPQPSSAADGLDQRPAATGRGDQRGRLMADANLYDTDIAAWSEQQAGALRRRAANELDWDNVAEEIESLSRSDKRAIRSRLAMICEHLLKWHFQPDARSGSWRGSVRAGRDKIADLIEESPSLADYPAAHLAGPRGAYARGRCKAADETELVGLPETCPWTIEQVLDHAFWPEPSEPLA
jgi:hypothetical protein